MFGDSENNAAASDCLLFAIQEDYQRSATGKSIQFNGLFSRSNRNALPSGSRANSVGVPETAQTDTASRKIIKSNAHN